MPLIRGVMVTDPSLSRYLGSEAAARITEAREAIDQLSTSTDSLPTLRKLTAAFQSLAAFAATHQCDREAEQARAAMLDSAAIAARGLEPTSEVLSGWHRLLTQTTSAFRRRFA